MRRSDLSPATRAMPQSPPCPRSVASTSEETTTKMFHNTLSSTDYNRPDWLPQKVEEQLELGIRVIRGAFKQKDSGYEQAIRCARKEAEDLKRKMSEAQERCSQLEVEAFEGQKRLAEVQQENMKLNSLVWRLRNRNTELEGFRRKLLVTIQDRDVGQEIGATDSAAFEEMDRTEPYATEVQTERSAHRTHPASADQWSSVSSIKKEYQRSSSTTSSKSAGPKEKSNNGKEFFHEVGRRLPKSSFDMFIRVIADYNEARIGFEQAIERGAAILGDDNGDLRTEFRKMLLGKVSKRIEKDQPNERPVEETC